MTWQDIITILEIASLVSFGILIGYFCAIEYYSEEMD